MNSENTIELTGNGFVDAYNLGFEAGNEYRRANAAEKERDELEAFAKRLERAAHDKLGVTLFGVDYVTEDFMLHVRDTLTAERDEWKAKAEGLTEALEKLGCSVLANGTVFEPAPHVDAHSKAQSKTEPMLSEQSESLSDESDSREKLEADVRKHYAYSTTTLLYPPSANKTTDMLRSLPIDTVVGWLDRQASITRREVLTQPDERDEQIAELTAQLYDLTAERDALAEDPLACNRERDGQRPEEVCEHFERKDLV